MTKQQQKDLDAQLGQLTIKELENLAQQVEARQKLIKEQLESEQFGKIATTAIEVSKAMEWVKLPKLMLTPNDSGDAYEVSYFVKTTASKTGSGATTRTAQGVNGGDITIKKIDTINPISVFRDAENKEYATLKELIYALKTPDGKPESERCWDISKKGISSSDIVTKYHAGEVTLIFKDGTQKLVKDAVEEMKAARATS